MFSSSPSKKKPLTTVVENEAMCVVLLSLMMIVEEKFCVRKRSETVYRVAEKGRKQVHTLAFPPFLPFLWFRFHSKKRREKWTNTHSVTLLFKGYVCVLLRVHT